MPNQDQVLSVVRAFLAILGTALTAHGTVSTTMWEQITGLAIMLVPILWGMYAHTDSSKLAAVEAMPDVQKIVVKADAGNGVGAALADPARTKVDSQ